MVVPWLATPDAAGQWIRQESGTNARLRGLHVVNDQVVWASGERGTVLRTTDGGRAWRTRLVEDAAELDFRDVHAFDDNVACLLSIGPGERSRIYRTADGGATWSLRYRMDDPKGFLDAIAFWDRDHGVALGDPIDGRFTLLSTDDGGERWKRIPADTLPRAFAGEGAFAASGTCLIAQGDSNAWFGTGGAKTARVFRTTDRGRTWTVVDTPITAGAPSSGIFSLAFRDAKRGIAIGGDYRRPDESSENVALTDDGGASWKRPDAPVRMGYRSAVVFRPGGAGEWVAVGTSGSNTGSMDANCWRSLGEGRLNSVESSASGQVWAVGDNGSLFWLPRK